VKFPASRARKTKRDRFKLFEFVASRPDMTWEQRWKEWNRAFPAEKYRFASNMQRDYALISNPTKRG